MMIDTLKNNLIYFFLICIFLLNLASCSKVRDSAGVSRKSFDEYNVIENPPLVIPPDFNLLSNNQLKGKNINNAENELAQEILFGLDDKIQNQEVKSSTMDTILQNANALEDNSKIREDIDEIIFNNDAKHSPSASALWRPSGKFFGLMLICDFR